MPQTLNHIEWSKTAQRPQNTAPTLPPNPIPQQTHNSRSHMKVWQQKCMQATAPPRPHFEPPSLRYNPQTGDLDISDVKISSGSALPQQPTISPAIMAPVPTSPRSMRSNNRHRGGRNGRSGGSRERPPLGLPHGGTSLYQHNPNGMRVRKKRIDKVPSNYWPTHWLSHVEDDTLSVRVSGGNPDMPDGRESSPFDGLRSFSSGSEDDLVSDRLEDLGGNPELLDRRASFAFDGLRSFSSLRGDEEYVFDEPEDFSEFLPGLEPGDDRSSSPYLPETPGDDESIRAWEPRPRQSRREASNSEDSEIVGNFDEMVIESIESDEGDIWEVPDSPRQASPVLPRNSNTGVRDDTEYPVQKIHGEKFGATIHAFHLEWVGYPGRRDWVEYRHCSCDELIDQFREKMWLELLAAGDAGREESVALLLRLSDQSVARQISTMKFPKTPGWWFARRDAATGRFQGGGNLKSVTEVVRQGTIPPPGLRAGIPVRPPRNQTARAHIMPEVEDDDDDVIWIRDGIVEKPKPAHIFDLNLKREGSEEEPVNPVIRTGDDYKELLDWGRGREAVEIEARREDDERMAKMRQQTVGAKEAEALRVSEKKQRKALKAALREEKKRRKEVERGLERTKAERDVAEQGVAEGEVEAKRREKPVSDSWERLVKRREEREKKMREVIYRSNKAGKI